MRSGDAYVASLRDERAVYLDGERVDDVTKHPAFVEPIRRIAETYDRAKAAAGEPALTFGPGDGSAPQQHVARPALGGGPRLAAASPPVLGRAVVRPHGADARPRRV